MFQGNRRTTLTWNTTRLGTRYEALLDREKVVYRDLRTANTFVLVFRKG
jgi:hypothetical protein